MGKELSDKDVIEYNEKILPSVKDREPLYSIATRPRNYSVKRGDNVEIDIYLTGLGIPDEGKIFILFSSPNIIDVASKGVLTSCIQFSPKKLKGKDTITPVSGEKYVERFDLDPNGVTIHLNKGYFLPVPKLPIVSRGQPLMAEVMAEKQFDGYDPISVSLKTLSKAKSGDYKIDIALTYRYKSTLKQASKTVDFRITSWWDRNQWWILTAGAIIALISLILLAINIFLPIGG